MTRQRQEVRGGKPERLLRDGNLGGRHASI
jgi:hypothetical protein